jgi:ATP-binding cassette subfamily B (MDR/TAP) protein 1
MSEKASYEGAASNATDAVAHTASAAAPAASLSAPQAAPAAEPTPSKGGFFSRSKKASPPPEDEDEKKEIPVDTPHKVEEITPVSFSTLFRCATSLILKSFLSSSDADAYVRYSTKFELFLDFIGLICAAAAGAAMVCLLLLSTAETPF